MDFDLGGWLSGLFSPASSGTPTTTMVGDYAMPTFGADGKSPIMGWLGNNVGNLAQVGAGLQQGMQQKPQQVQAQPLQVIAPPRPQVQAPQYTGMLNTPVAPVNPVTGR